MATIALYANKINQMPALIKDVKKATGVLRTQLGIVQKKCQAVDPAVCNLDDVISTISASTKTQDEKSAMLETFSETVEQFAQDTEAVDDKAANRINKNKDDFYDKYSYLKPDCEKSGWEKFCDGCKKAWEWCKENWVSIVTIVVAIIATVAIIVASVLTFGAAAVALVAAVGALVGVLGQLLSDTIAFIRTGLKTGEWTWPGSWEDYLGALFGGVIGGILILTGIAPLACAVDGWITTLFTEGLKGLTGKSDKSLAEIWLAAAVDGVTAAALSKVFDFAADGLGKYLSKKISVLSRLSGKGSYSASYKMIITKLKKNIIKNYTWKTLRNGVVSNLFGDGFKNILTGLGIMDVIKDGVKSVLLDMCKTLPRPLVYAPVAPVIHPIPGLGLLPLRFV